MAIASDHHLHEDAGVERAGRGVASDRRERIVDDHHVAGVVVGRGLVGEAELPGEVDEAACGADGSRVGCCAGAGASERIGLTDQASGEVLAGEEGGSRPERVSGRRREWPHGGRQLSW
jgi:hypothetical protein